MRGICGLSLVAHPNRLHPRVPFWLFFKKRWLCSPPAFGCCDSRATRAVLLACRKLRVDVPRGSGMASMQFACRCERSDSAVSGSVRQSGALIVPNAAPLIPSIQRRHYGQALNNCFFKRYQSYHDNMMLIHVKISLDPFKVAIACTSV